MPKKSRRNRTKGGAAGAGGGASGVGGFSSNIQREMDLADFACTYSPDTDRKVALWMYEWSAAKDRLMNSILDALAVDSRIHPLFNRDCISPKFINLLEYWTASYVAVTPGSTPHSILDDTSLATTKPFLVESTNVFFRKGCKTSPPPLQRRKKIVEDILEDARSMALTGQGDVAAALYCLGMRNEMSSDFVAHSLSNGAAIWWQL